MRYRPLLLGSILAFGCAQPASRAPTVRPVPASVAPASPPEAAADEVHLGDMPKPHDCPAFSPGSPLRALMPPVIDDVRQTRALLFGCPSDVRLRPEEQSGTSVQFGCPGSPEPTIVLHGHGSVPFPVLDPFHEYQREVTELYQVTDVIGRLPEKRFLYGLQKDPIPRCATKPLGLLVLISNYRRVNWIVERLTRWIRHDDLDLEVIIRFVPPEPLGTIFPSVREK